MSSSGVNFSGLGSGIDTESLISRLIDIEKRPAQTIARQQAAIKQKQAAYATVSARLLGIQSAAYNLNRLRSFDLVAATTSSSDAVTVSADTGAQIGSHTIVINQLAQAQSSAPRAAPARPMLWDFPGSLSSTAKRSPWEPATVCKPSPAISTRQVSA